MKLQFRLSQLISFSTKKNLSSFYRCRPLSNQKETEKYNIFKKCNIRFISSTIKGYCDKIPEKIHPFQDDNEVFFEDDDKRESFSARENESIDINSTLMTELESLSLAEKKKLLHLLDKKIKASTESLFEAVSRAANEISKDNIVLLMNGIKSALIDEQVNTLSLQNRKEFKILLSKLRKLYPEMDPEELLLVFRCLDQMEVDSNSVYIKHLLQILKFHTSSLSVKQIIQLDFMLKKMTNPLAKSLYDCLHLVAEKHIVEGDLGSVSLHDLIILMGFCIDSKVNSSYRVLEEISSRGVHSSRYALSVLWNIFDLPSPPLRKFLVPPEREITVEILCKECLNVMAKNITEYTKGQLITTLTKASHSFENGNEFVYHEYFLHELSERVVDEGWDFDRMGAIVVKLFQLQYINENLLRALVSRFEPSQVSDKTKLFHLISPLCSADDPPEGLHSFLDGIFSQQNTSQLMRTFPNRPYVMKAAELCSLNYFSQEFLESLLSDAYLDKIFSSHRLYQYLDMRNLLLVNNSLRSQSEMDRLCMSAALKDRAFELVSQNPGVRDYNPSEVISGIFASPSQVVPRVHFDKELFIDQLLVVDEDGCPVQVGEGGEIEFLRRGYTSYHDFDIDPNHKRIAVINVPEQWCFKPGGMVHGAAKLERRCLEREGFSVLYCLESLSPVQRQEELERALLHLGVKLSM